MRSINRDTPLLTPRSTSAVLNMLTVDFSNKIILKGNLFFLPKSSHVALMNTEGTSSLLNLKTGTLIENILIKQESENGRHIQVLNSSQNTHDYFQNFSKTQKMGAYQIEYSTELNCVSKIDDIIFKYDEQGKIYQIEESGKILFSKEDKRVCVFSCVIC